MTIPFIPFIPADAAVIPGPPEATAILAAIEAEHPEPPSVVVTDVSGPESDAPTPGWWRIDVYRHGARWQTLYALPARPGAAGGTEAVARAVAGYLAGG